MLFYPLTSLITGTQKGIMCVYNNSPSSPSRRSISLGPPPRLLSDKVNNVCLTNPAHKYLFWKLPHPTGDTHTHTPLQPCWGIYTVTVLPDQYHMCTHTHNTQVDPSVTQARPYLGHRLTSTWQLICTSLGNKSSTFSSNFSILCWNKLIFSPPTSHLSFL